MLVKKSGNCYLNLHPDTIEADSVKHRFPSSKLGSRKVIPIKISSKLCQSNFWRSQASRTSLFRIISAYLTERIN